MPIRSRIFLSRTLSGPADRASIASHGNGLLLLDDVLEESLGALQLPAVDRLSRLAGVLERHPEVRPAGASRLRRRNLSRRVPNLNHRKLSGQPGLGIAPRISPSPSRMLPPLQHSQIEWQRFSKAMKVGSFKMISISRGLLTILTVCRREDGIDRFAVRE